MLRLHLVRHGQTALSVANVYCGELDPPLDDEGRKMAGALAERYQATRWRAIHASPLLRARQTAQAIADRSANEVTLEPGLHELRYGAWEGRGEAELRRDQPEAFRAWLEHPSRLSPPSGETATQVADRVMAVITAIVAAHHDGDVLVVSHKATLRIALCRLLGIDVDRYRDRIAQPLASVSVIAWSERGPRLESLGDVTHLA